MSGKIFITGAGRAGTTFLIQLLTRLGEDTGFKPYTEGYCPSFRAGCEYELPYDIDSEPMEEIRARIAAAPRVIKGPIWGLCLKVFLGYELGEVDHVILPFRDLDIAAESRLSVGLDWMVDNSLTGEDKIRDQANILAMVLGRTVEACMLYSIPLTFMHFPLLVQNPEHCYERLSRAFELDQSRFIEEFDLLANPRQVVFK